MNRSITGIIMARGGSKGIPGKNIRLLNGKPLIAYAIEAALKSKYINRLIVSTDSNDIASISRELGAEVPFIRPGELALDTVADRPVLQHSVSWLRENQNYQSDFVLHLRCTTPFKTNEDIDAVVEKWLETGADSVRGVTAVNGVHHPYWMFKKNENNLAEPIIPGISIEKYYQRQLLPKVYRLNGVVDGISTDILLHHKNLWGDKMALVEVPEERSLDIDTFQDFELAEFLMERRSED